MERASATADPAAIEVVRRHRGRLLAVARRHSYSPEDAEDAFQRGVEILLKRAPTNDPAQLLPWMTTVVKHEAFAIRRQRVRHGEPSTADQIEPLAGLAVGTAELAERRERLRLGAEALGRLKPQEVRALLLRAEGLSYREICERTGWSYTKVNRCLSEGRRAFLKRVAGIEGGAECARLAPLLSALADGEASAEDVAALRPHVSGCLACRARLREYRGAPAAAAAVAPAGLLGWVVGALRDAAAGGAGLAQAVGAHKAVAVAVSAAVVAGGGAVVVVPEVGPAPRPPGTRVAPPPPSAPRLAPPRLLAPRAPAAAAGPRRGALRSKRAASRSGRDARRSVRRRAPASPERQQLEGDSGGEFAPRGVPVAPTAPPEPESAAAAPRGGEFAP